MKLIVGLGNPGKKFIATRHNIGRATVKYLAQVFNFPNFKLKDNLKAFVTEKRIKNKKIILAILTTYMNDSGKGVKKLVDYYNIKPESLLIIHDELDLPLGKLKLSFGRSSAGHKGVQSIIDNLKTNKFYRLRIGIENRKTKKIPTEKYVLEKFNKKEKEIIEKKIKILILKTISCLSAQGLRLTSKLNLDLRLLPG